VLAHLRFLWGRPVHLQTVLNEDMMLFSLAEVGSKPTRERITADLPKPANVI
jgi:hypothetical protein